MHFTRKLRGFLRKKTGLLKCVTGTAATMININCHWMIIPLSKEHLYVLRTNFMYICAMWKYTNF